MTYLPKKEQKDDNVVTEEDVTLTVLSTKSKNMIVDTKLIGGRVVTTDSTKNLTFTILLFWKSRTSPYRL